MTRSQEHEDERYPHAELIDSDDEFRIYSPPPRPMRLGWRGHLIAGFVFLALFALGLALVLGLREEWRIIGRLFR